MNNKDTLIEMTLNKVRSLGVKVTKKQVALIVDAIFSADGAILDCLKSVDARISITKFGAFQAVLRSPRIMRNPKTGEMVSVPARKRMRFVPSAVFLRELDK